VIVVCGSRFGLPAPSRRCSTLVDVGAVGDLEQTPVVEAHHVAVGDRIRDPMRGSTGLHPVVTSAEEIWFPTEKLSYRIPRSGPSPRTPSVLDEGRALGL